MDGETLRGFPSVWQRAFPDGIAQLAGGCGRNLVHILDRYHRIRQHFFELCQNGRLVNYRIRRLPDQQQPGFVLLYLNASQNCIRLAVLPAETAIPFGQGEATLAQCYAAAGPARCREALLEPLALPETTRYLALSPSVLAAIADRYGMLRVGFSGALTADELAQCSLSGGVQALSAREAQSLFSGWDKDGTLPPSHRAAARAAVWDAFFRQDLELLPTTLPAALRAHSSELLTDLTAQDFLTLESTLEFLANGNAAVSADALPGAWNPTRRFYGLTDASRASVQTLFNVWPTEAQAASSSEP